MADLLLHSPSSIAEWLLPVLDAAGVRDLVEVGAEDGLFTGALGVRAAERGGRLVVIEPEPRPSLRARLAALPAAELVEAPSPAALDLAGPADAWILDGDHNHATVSAELAAVARIARAGERLPLIVLHDVCWPWARRDLYYDPARVPGRVHPHVRDRGVAPGEPGTVPGGFHGRGAYAVAEREGGPANGVLTAVEDHLAGRDDLAFARIPSVFGLGILWPRAAPWAGAVEAALAPRRDDPVLARLEANRIALYLRVLELQESAAAGAARAEDAGRRAAEAEARAAAASARAARAEAEADEMRATLAWRAAERARRLRDALAPEGSAGRRALDALAAAAGGARRRDVTGGPGAGPR
jgi:hypothetical protein